MAPVIEEHLALPETIRNLLPKVDFYDVFSTTNHKDDLAVISHSIFNTTPKWVAVLFNIRNRIVRLLGLQYELPDDYHEQFEVGGYVKFFKIFDISENQVVLGADDTHLNFRAVITRTQDLQYNIKVTTLVEYNNTMGKRYMMVVKPFHRIVVKHMVKNAYHPIN